MEEPLAAGSTEAFQQLLRAALAKDNGARERLYLDYGPYFRRVISKRLKDKRIEWATTPHDVFDTVVLRVWEDDALNSLQTEVEYLKYFSRAIEREVCDLRRRLTAGCRDYRRIEVLDGGDSILTAKDADPVRRASLNEEWDAIRSLLCDEDLQVLEMWLDGQKWSAIGAQFGLRMETIRKRFHRTLAILRKAVAE